MKILGLVILLFLHFDSGNWSKQMDIDDYFPIEEYFPLLLNTRYIYESIEEDRNGKRSGIVFKCGSVACPT